MLCGLALGNLLWTNPIVIPNTNVISSTAEKSPYAWSVQEISLLVLAVVTSGD